MSVKEYWCRFKYPFNTTWHKVNATSADNARRQMIKGSHFKMSDVVIAKAKPAYIPQGAQSYPIPKRRK